MPPGGNGVYSFSMYLLFEEGERAFFNMMLNDQTICIASGDNDSNGVGYSTTGSCSAVVRVDAGNM